MDILSTAIGVVVGAVGAVFFGQPVQAQSVTTSPPAPFGTGSGELITYASQPVDVTLLVFMFIAFTAITLLLITFGAMLFSAFSGLRRNNDNNTNWIGTNQKVERLEAENSDLKDKSDDRHDKMLEKITDAFNQLLDQNRRQNEIRDFVPLESPDDK